MSLVQAKLVYDGGSNSPNVPSEMGTPKAGQMQGTPREQTSELASRVCYDSLGSGRSSPELHRHIQEVGHLSVYEHTPITVSFSVQDKNMLQAFLAACLNRPGVYVRIRDKSTLRITANFRAILEWDKTVNNVDTEGKSLEKLLGASLRNSASSVAPLIVTTSKPAIACSIVTPEVDQEKWVSLFIGCSRVCSHEIVRHGDWTAISQRSGRYCDEGSSPVLIHPLLQDYLDKTKDAAMLAMTSSLVSDGSKAYETIVNKVLPWKSGELDKVNPGSKGNSLAARKQCRSAARGFLGTALYTEIIFSASVAQWKWMLKLRGSEAADAEIRELFARSENSVLSSLRESQYADSFKEFTQVPSSDGIGMTLTYKPV